MRRKHSITALVAIGGAMLAWAPKMQALPAFARQMNMPCSACHFQAFPVLKKFGQNFKASGYTMIGDQAKIEDEGLSLPAVFNASAMIKIRYQKTNGTDGGFDTARAYAYDQAAGQPAGTELATFLAANPTGFGGRPMLDSQKNRSTNSGQLQFPDEFAVFFAGRVSEHIGFLLEFGTPNPAQGLGFKLPFMYEVSNVKLGFIPYYTDTLGAAYGFELLSTGAVRNIRPMEHRTQTSAQQFLGTDGGATGAALVAHHDLFFANVSAWTPESAAGNRGLAGGAPTTPGLHSTPSALYERFAFTPSIGDFDLAIGVQNWGGKDTVIRDPVDNITALRVRPTASSVDAQIQGEFIIPIGIYVSHARAPASKTHWTLSNNTSTLDPGAGVLGGFNTSQWYTLPYPGASATPLYLVKEPVSQNTFNPGPREKSATAMMLSLGVVPNHLVLFLAYLKGDNGTAADPLQLGTYNLTDPTGAVLLQNVMRPAQNAVRITTFGVEYHIAQNVLFVVEHSRMKGAAYAKDGQRGIDTATVGTGSYKYGYVSGAWAPGGTGDQLTTFKIEAAF